MSKFSIGARVRINFKGPPINQATGRVDSWDNPVEKPAKPWKREEFTRDCLPVLLDEGQEARDFYAYRPYYLVNTRYLELLEEDYGTIDDYPDFNVPKGDVYCSCAYPQVEKRNTSLFGGGELFNYCVKCKKEVIFLSDEDDDIPF